jgi:hypothetical protein
MQPSNTYQIILTTALIEAWYGAFTIMHYQRTPIVSLHILNLALFHSYCIKISFKWSSITRKRPIEGV